MVAGTGCMLVQVRLKPLASFKTESLEVTMSVAYLQNVIIRGVMEAGSEATAGSAPPNKVERAVQTCIDSAQKAGRVSVRATRPCRQRAAGGASESGEFAWAAAVALGVFRLDGLMQPAGGGGSGRDCVARAGR